jgi:hypothetical protein
LSADILKETLHLDQAGDLITASLTELRISEDPPRDIDLQILPLFDDRQSITGHLLILRDITARKKTEETLTLTRKKYGVCFRFTILDKTKWFNCGCE